ncbi:MAG: SAM-dependent chlorinase/fluorinase [bacterium]|nr:SAM-dependent chlorinase/fluorinase [bacterium]
MDGIYVVADYGQVGDLAWTELRIALASQCRGWQMFSTVVPKFNTPAAGFVAAQIARGLDRINACILINVDPRTDNRKVVRDGAGAPFVCAVLDNGVLVFSPNAGYSLAFLKSRIKNLYILHNGGANGQFRSRDLFPGLMAQVERTGFVGFQKFDLAKIPDPPTQVVGYVDGYGNVKTTMTRSQARVAGWRPGKKMYVMMGSRRKVEVHCAASIMGVLPGQLALAPGSSGDKNNPYMELAVRATGPSCVRSGAHSLSFPQPGTKFDLQSVAKVSASKKVSKRAVRA